MPCTDDSATVGQCDGLSVPGPTARPIAVELSMNLVAADVSPLKLFITQKLRSDSRRMLREGNGSWSQCAFSWMSKLSMNRVRSHMPGAALTPLRAHSPPTVAFALQR